jgi:hypothetical protein
MEPQLAVPGAREHAVEHERMQVDVEIECPTETLHNNDGPASCVPEPARLGPRPQVALYSAEQHASHRRAQVVAPSQGVADAWRQGEHPLSHGHLRPDVIHEVRRALGHATSATGRTEPAPLAREGHEPLRAAARAAKPREPTGVPSTPQERVELVVDETRQPLAIAELRRLGPKRVVVVAHDLVQDRRGRVARRVRP